MSEVKYNLVLCLECYDGEGNGERSDTTIYLPKAIEASVDEMSSYLTDLYLDNVISDDDLNILMRSLIDLDNFYGAENDETRTAVPVQPESGDSPAEHEGSRRV